MFSLKKKKTEEADGYDKELPEPHFYPPTNIISSWFLLLFFLFTFPFIRPLQKGLHGKSWMHYLGKVLYIQ
jgi:hypothetical protein